MRAYLFVCAVAAAVTYLLVPLARRVAERSRAMTPVRERDVHAVPTPRLGGTAMLLGFGAAMLLASQMDFTAGLFAPSAPVYAVLGAAVLVCALGVVDDLWGLDAVTKFLGQGLAAGLMAWQGLQLVSLPIAGVTLASSQVLLLLTVLAVLVAINGVNFVDGLDGLAAGIVAIAASAFFLYSYMLSRDASPTDFSSLASLITAALVGVCLGFLPHNLHPARIFMGDSGSMLIGLLLASSTIAITGQVDPSQLSRAEVVPAFLPIVLPLAVFLVPLADVLLAVVRRAAAGRAPWAPDKEHLHHRLLSLGHSHGRAVLIMYVWTAAVAYGVASLALLPLEAAALVMTVALVLALLLTLGPLRERGSRPAALPQASTRGSSSPVPEDPAPAQGAAGTAAADRPGAAGPAEPPRTPVPPQQAVRR